MKCQEHDTDRGQGCCYISPPGPLGQMLDLLLRAFSPQRVIPARIPAKLLQHVPCCQLVGYAGIFDPDRKHVIIKHDVPTGGRAVRRKLKYGTPARQSIRLTMFVLKARYVVHGLGLFRVLALIPSCFEEGY